MATKRSQPRSRKRGSRSRARPAAGPPTPARSGGPSRAQARSAQTALRDRSATSFRTAGERPESVFGPVPVSEAAILLGGICAAIGFISGASLPVIVGVIVCALGVFEFTAREHFSGYRSHTLLLSGIAAAGTLFGLAAVTGARAGQRTLYLLPAAGVFALVAWLLQRRFRVARDARVHRAAIGR